VNYEKKDLKVKPKLFTLIDVYYVKGRPYHLLDYIRPTSGKYITLESFTNTPHKTIHVIHIEDEQAAYSNEMGFIVGRDNSVHVRITDISVSRNHSMLTYYNGEFYLKDTQSKFGTLVLMQAPFPIPYKLNWDITMQIGKYLSGYFMF
jgi:hypothetical protein